MKTHVHYAILALCLPFLACDKAPTPPLEIASITVIVPNNTMQVGQTQQLTAVLKSSTGETLTGRPITWSSSDVTVASVSATGAISALKPSNYAVVITASSDGKNGTSSISITPGSIATVQLFLKDSILVMGKSTTATVTLADSAGNIIKNTQIQFSSSDTNVARINAQGLIETTYDGVATIAASFGGKSSRAELTVRVDQSSPLAYFQRYPAYGPALQSYTPNDGGVATVVSADVNRDGRKDLVVHLSRLRSAIENATLPLNAPVTVDRIVVLAGTADGSLRDITQELFGSATVDLGGANSRNIAVFDLNNDQYPDFVFATNREDGRPCQVARQQCANWGTQNAALVSSVNGTYKRILFGEENYHHSVAVVPTATGIEVITSNLRLDSNNRQSIESYTYQNGAFISSERFPSFGGGFLFVPLIRMGAHVSTHLLSYGPALRQFPSPPALMLASNSGIRSWSIVDSLFEALNFSTIGWRTWSGDTCDKCVITFAENGQDFATLGYNDGCTAKLSPNSDPLLIAKRTSSLIVGGLRGRSMLTESVDAISDMRLIAYDVIADKLVRRDVIFDQITDANYNRHECRDINRDGYDDIVTYAIQKGGQPIVYLNDQQGSFRRLSQSPFPASLRSSGYDRGIFADIDGDSIDDLIYMSDNRSFEIWRGRRPLLR